MKGATKTSYKIVVLARLHEAAVSRVVLTNAAIYRLLILYSRPSGTLHSVAPPQK